MPKNDLQEKKRRRRAEELITAGHLRMGLGRRGLRQPDDDEEDEGGGGFGNPFEAHPLLTDMPEGMADKNVSRDPRVNDAKKEADRRNNELNLTLSNKLGHTHKPGATLTATPKLTRH